MEPNHQFYTCTLDRRLYLFALFNCQCQWFLDKNIFTGFSGLNSERKVQMMVSTDENQIYLFIIK